MALNFSQERRDRLSRIIDKLGSRESALIPALFLAKEEFGFVSREVARYVGDLLGLSAARVLSVATFYTMIPKEPVGKYHIQVCWNISCSLMGADHLLSHLEKKLGIRAGETTKDGRFTLTGEECLAACGSAPVMLVNEDLYEDLTEQRVDEILRSLT